MASGIKIKINCDIRGAEKAMERLDAQVAKLQKAERRVGHINDNYQKLGEDARKAYAEAEKALSKYRAAESKADKRGRFVAQRILTKNPYTQQEDVDKAVAQDGAFNNMSSAASDARARYEELSAAADKLAQKHERLGTTLQQAKGSLAATRQETNNLQQEINSTDYAIDRFKGAFTGLGQRIAGAFQSGVEKAKAALAGLPGAVANLVKRAASGFASGAKMMGKGAASLGTHIKNVVSKLGMFHRSANKGQGAAKGFSNAIIRLGTMLKLMVIRQALHGMIAGAKEGFENLAQYSTDCNANVSALMSSLTQLKNSFATAFAPILSVVTPILVGLINMLSKAATAVGMLFAALSGAKSFTRATAVNEDYAKSLNTTSKAAKAAQSILAGFDELNVLSDSGSGGGGISPSEMFEEVQIPSWIQGIKDLIMNEEWDSLGAFVANSINNGLSTIKDAVSWETLSGPIVRIVNGITGTINSLVSNIDWNLMGQTLGTGANTLINTLFLLFTGINWQSLGSALAAGLNGMIATIDWYHLGETIGAWFSIAINTMLGFVQTFDWAGAGAAFGTTLQGLFDYVDWDSIGELLGGLWNGVISFISNAVQSFDWEGGATDLASGANTMVASVDWAGTGQSISDFFTSALEFFTTAVEEFDWYALGQSIKTLLVNIDWEKIVEDLSEAIGAALGGLAALCWGAIEDAVHAIGDYFKEKFHEYGDNIVAGLLFGILDAIVGIGRWIYDNVFEPFIEGFKKAFGINSPSTVMSDMGGYMIDGLKGGLTGLWDKVKGFFTEAIDGIKENFSLENLKDVGSNAVTGLMNGLKSVGSKVVSWGGGILENIKDALGIHSPSTETEEVGEYTVAGYINGLDAYSARLGAALDAMGKAILNVFSATAQMVLNQQREHQNTYLTTLDTWMAAVKDRFTAFYSNLSTQANGWASGLQGTLNEMVKAAQKASSSIAASLSSARANTSSLSSLGNGASTSRAVATRMAPGVTLKVPAYATGAVLPANNPHLAIVGDQKRGTNIETQMKTMVQAFNAALDARGGNREIISGMRDILNAIQEGHIIMVDKREIGRTASEYGATAARSGVTTPISRR